MDWENIGAEAAEPPKKKPKADVNVKATNMVVTWNNYPENWKEIIEDEWDCKWFAGSPEVAKTGTPHIQGFMGFKNARYTFSVRKKFGIWCDKMYGRLEDNTTYCSKQHELWTCGTLPQFNSQNGTDEQDRWQVAWDLAKKGDFESVEPALRFKHFGGMLKIHAHYQQELEDLDEYPGVWIWGPPNTGKSTYARTLGERIYDKPLTKWWDGYDGQDTVLMDDVGTSDGVWLGAKLKRWADKFPFPCEMKGTTSFIRPKKIVITSNYSMEDVFVDKTTMLALSRRFPVVIIKSEVFE